MNIFRNILSVVVGYATFVISAVLLFQLSGINPHADPSIVFIGFTVSYGILFSFVGGLVTQLISRTNQLTMNYILAGIMAGFAAFSMVKSAGNHYSQIAAIFLFAPSSIIGGLIYLKKIKKVR